MGMLISDYRRYTSDVIGLGSAVTFNFVPGAPVEVVRVGVVSDADGFLATGTSTFDLRIDYHAKVSGPTVGYAITTAYQVLNTVTTQDMQEGNGIYANLTTPITMKAGEKLTMNTSAGGAASAGSSAMIFVEFRDLPFTELGRPTTAPGDGSPASGGSIENMTEV